MTDAKISELAVNTDPQADDVLILVDDPGGTPETQKITVENLMLGTEDIVPAALVYKSGTQNITNASWTLITFDTESYDTDSIHDTGSNTDRLTCKTKGKYHVYGMLRFSANNNGMRIIAFHNQDATILAQEFSIANWAGNQTYMQMSIIVDMDVDDYVYMRGYQSSGSTLTCGGSEFNTYFGMIRIGD